MLFNILLWWIMSARYHPQAISLILIPEGLLPLIILRCSCLHSTDIIIDLGLQQPNQFRLSTVSARCIIPFVVVAVT